ncbi:MAG: sugar phosphate isomerase/epimerase, partial [Anaerolineales bacterium]|nr:sugar phosphate isomerase/epimerase [Anaerolineales bacterium]
MKFAQSSFVYFNYSLQDAIRQLAQFGYDGVEIWGGRPHLYRRDLDDQIDALTRLLAQNNLTVCNFIPAQFRYPSILCSSNENVRRDSVEYIKSAMDNATRVGAPSVSVCPGMTLHSERVATGWAQLRQSLIEILEYAERNNLRVLIEPAHIWETTLIRTVDDAARMIAEIKSPRLGVLLDTGHAHVNGENLADAVRQLKNVPFHVHIDDNDGASDSHHVPGAGKINYAPFVRALKEIGYTGFVSAELGFQYTLDPDAAVQQSLVTLRAMFA